MGSLFSVSKALEITGFHDVTVEEDPDKTSQLQISRENIEMGNFKVNEIFVNCCNYYCYCE